MRIVTAPAIADQGGRPYLAWVAAALRLFTLLAMLMMPFGMAAAEAAPAGQHHSASGAQTEHCPENQPGGDLPGAVADCAMPCSSALPAADVTPVKPEPPVRGPSEPRLQVALAGIELEIATPPPKLA